MSKRSVAALVGGLAAAALTACSGGAPPHRAAGPVPTSAAASAAASAAPAVLKVEVPPPPFSDGIFPCTSCHTEPDLPVDRTRRTLGAHDDIVLKHDEEHRWCLDCHDAGNRDSLHLASGELVPFAESYRLCGQCHGEKYRDWRAGVHGRRKGLWNGAKEYLLCVHCHNPHAPRFSAVAPMPPPHRPVRTSADRREPLKGSAQ